MVSGCSEAPHSTFASRPRPIFYVPMQEDHKTVYGMLFYSGDRSLADTPFAPWNIKATEICFETVSYSADVAPSETCQRLQRYNREGSMPDLLPLEEDKQAHDESFFSILVDGHAKTLRFTSIILHSKEYTYALKFSSPPSGDMPLNDDFINFGNIGVLASPGAKGQDPKLSFAGIIMFPFKSGIKTSRGNCSAVIYDLPYVMQRLPAEAHTRN